ncbi:MAG: response regulator [Spirochaetales bacterium]|nr:response regulator [Spirochaetales bacterium]
MDKKKDNRTNRIHIDNLSSEERQQLREQLLADDEKNYLELIRIITFSGNVATKIIGLLDEKTILKTVIDEFKTIKKYSAVIFLHSNDRKTLTIETITLDRKTLADVEAVSGAGIDDFIIDPIKSPILRGVVEGKKTVLVTAIDIIKEFVPQKIAKTISRIIKCDNQKIILAPLIREEKSIGVFGMSGPELAEYFLPSANNLATIISDALQLCYEQKQRLKTEIDLIKEKSYLQTAYSVSVILGSSGDFDEASRVIREELDLGAVIIITIDQLTHKAYTKGIAVEMPDVFFGIVRQITIDLKKNGKARRYLDSLASITHVTIDELFDHFIESDKTLKKLFAPVSKIIARKKAGDILAGPLLDSYNKKIGIFLFAKKYGNSYSTDELPLIKSIVNLVSISLENQLHQQKLIRQIITNKFRTDIWRLATDKQMDGDTLIQEFLNRLGPTIGLSRACYNRLIGKNPEESDLECVIEWNALGVKPSLGTITPSVLIKTIIPLIRKSPEAHLILNDDNILSIFPKKAKKLIKPYVSFFKTSLNIENMLILYNIVNNRIDGMFSFEICSDNRKKPSWTDEVVDSIYECVKIVSHAIAEKEADKALQKSEEKFRTFIETASDLMFITDEHQTITYVNSSMARTLGYDREQLTGRHIYSVVGEDALDGFKASCHDLFSKGEISAETVWCTAGGKPIFGELKLVAIYNEKHDYQGSRGIFRDITEWKKHEEERKRFEARLRHFQKMETIGTLAGGIAHDFNNILSPIMGYIDMVLDDLDEDTELYDNLSHIHDSAIRAKELVQQILTFSRKTEGNPKPVNIVSHVKNYTALLRSLLPPNIRLITTINPNCGSILIDQSQIFRLLLNLSTNAQQSMEENGGTLTITLNPVEVTSAFARENPPLSKGSYICLSVGDTGHGMDTAVMERIFEPYFTTREVGKGTGLGLSVVHGITKSAGGDIFVESKTGKGSTFTLYFPRIDIDIKPEEKRKSNFQKGKERILFIDDEEQIVIMGKQMLERLGYQVISTTDSSEAISLFKKDKTTIDLVITDQTMPNVTGTMLIRELRRIKPDIPVILTSGFGKITSRQKTENITIQAYLSKPITMEEMSTTVRAVLEGRMKQEGDESGE